MSQTYVFARNAPDAEFDRGLAWAALLLAAMGLVMVYSSSIATAEAARYTGYNAAWFLARHGVFLGAALVAAIVVFLVPVRWWQLAAPWLFMLGVVLLVAVLVPGIGREVNGARRWLALPVISVQPSEIMKLAAVLYAADYTARKHAVLKSFQRGLLPMLAVMLLVSWLLLREPDFGALVVIAVTTFGILFLGGMNGRHFAALIGMLAAGFALLVVISPYRMQRIFGFMDPWADPLGRGYQLSHALIAFGRGEWLGVGLGASVEKLHYLPEAHTDFLLAVIAEELGFAGVLLVIVLFAWIVSRAFAIARQATQRERHFAALTALGIGIWIGFQALINMGVNMGLLPTKGLTLPLMSYGGSGLLVNFVALAMLLRIDWENRQLARGYMHEGRSARMRTILIMAGGTGGHIFPGLAVAAEMRAAGWDVVWMGARGGMEERLVPPHGYRAAWIRARAARGKGLLQKLLLPANLLYSFWESARHLRALKPDVVLGLGGYVAFPGGMMASLLDRPLALHEQNAIPGLANRVLSKVSDRVMVGFPAALPGAEWTGNPVRAEIAAIPAPEDRFAGRSGPLRVLVVGGSLGAQALNEALPKAVALLKDRPLVVHQAGEKHFDALKGHYAAAGVQGELLAFIDDMASRYAEADLVICRAGAVTVAELSAGGMASVLVPFPHAVDDHQSANARFLADQGAAILIQQRDLTAEKLAALIGSLDRAKLLDMARKARALGKPDAARVVAQRCIELASLKKAKRA